MTSAKSVRNFFVYIEGCFLYIQRDAGFELIGYEFHTTTSFIIVKYNM